MTTPLTGRPQTAEHIARRMASVTATRNAWSPERRDLFRARVAESQRRWTPEYRAQLAERQSETHRGKPVWWIGTDRTPNGPRRTPEEKRARQAAYERRRRAANPGLRVHQSVSAMVRQALGPEGKDGRTWEALVGYTRADLMAHLEARFTDGMSWATFGAWHIDHVIPRSAFAFESPSDPEFRACWALANLQPLWAVDNLRKAARRPAQA